jgi:insertion element IS1 protein InsB
MSNDVPWRMPHNFRSEGVQKTVDRYRTRIKRLVRRTLCFSKTEQMHDLVIGLFINRYEFGLSL